MQYHSHLHQHFRHPSDSHVHTGKLSPPLSSVPINSDPHIIKRQSNVVKDTVETIPSSNDIDSAMFERDKQIYKCSTLRQGGKFDKKLKPSILNCPLPDIPKSDNDTPTTTTADNSIGNQNNKNICYTRTFQRGIKLPGLKPIQPPMILTPSNNTTKSFDCHNSANTDSQKRALETVSTISTSTGITDTSETPSNVTNSTTKAINNYNTDLNQTDENVSTVIINPNDDTNYAVTEL